MTITFRSLRTIIKTFTQLWVAVLVALALQTAPICRAEDSQAHRPIHALLIAGGCCHDYAGQVKVLREGIQSRANVRVDVVWTDDGSTNPPLPIYDRVDWAKGYDVIIHDECAADNRDLSVMQRILDVHQTIPAVHLHCAMHSFRNGTDRWFRHLGMQSNSHGPQEPIAIEFINRDHPICRSLEDWTTGPEELYNNVKKFDAIPLAKGTQRYMDGDRQVVEEFVVAWTNETQGARSFSTTIGHNTSTVADARYLDLVTRGLLWACNRLDLIDKDKQSPQAYQGESSITLMENTNPKEDLEPTLPTPPVNATLVVASASTEETGKYNFAWRAFDGDRNTRWCASDGSYPQWIQAEFDEPKKLESILIHWESAVAYQFIAEGSNDGKEWTELLDASFHSIDQPTEMPLKSIPVKMLRVRGLGTKKGQWCSIREIELKGQGVERVFAKLDPTLASSIPGLGTDPFQKRGNATPRIVKLTEAEEQAVLQDVQVADGLEVRLFAAPPAVNYPVFVAAAPDGTLYVSSDGNGSLGRDPNRGRVLRLRDLDDDGRADEVKVFCTIDAPRGLIWDRDRLYLMHPPHLSALIDHDGDGVADEQKILVKNLAFGYDQRPADHTTNGLSMGLDGWLYIAGGDFGFLNAEGADGRRLTHRGGGVIRVRPDGTGLEIYSTGTRNILEVAISPTMDMFARDNTNDGGGWNVRFHHFMGGEDHGYPRRYINFPDECVPPLADYGGGSGCGAVYLHEAGWGDWNDAPLTADWGTGAIYHHQVRAKGPTFEELRPPKPVLRMTRPTDADVDAQGRLYCASWKGATFGWEGARVGYIVQVRPKGAVPEKLPEFNKLSSQELLEQLSSDSYRRRLAAMRELQVRGERSGEAWLGEQLDQRPAERKLVQHLLDKATDNECIEALSHTDAIVRHVARRQLVHRQAWQACLAAFDQRSAPIAEVLMTLGELHAPPLVEGLIARFELEKEADHRKQIATALCRLYSEEADWDGVSWGTRPDTRGPYYQPVPWTGTELIRQTLESYAANASLDESQHLIHQLRRHRIEMQTPLNRMVELALADLSAIPTAISELANSDQVPEKSIALLQSVATSSDTKSNVRLDAITAMTKVPSWSSLETILKAIQQMEDADPSQRAPLNSAVSILVRSSLAQQHVARLIELAKNDASNLWPVDAVIVFIATQNDTPAEARAKALEALQQAWSDASRKPRILNSIGNMAYRPAAARVLSALQDPDTRIRDLALRVADQLQIKPIPDDTPKTSSLEPEDLIEKAVSMRGDVTLGEVAFSKANCGMCHTVDSSQTPKGPFLGNIAKTYPRAELARNILDPNRTIAQGFKTEQFLMAGGQVYVGFVTLESAESVTIRDAKGVETLLEKEEIEERVKVATSSMPSGLLEPLTVLEFASLLDYLESLAK